MNTDPGKRVTEMELDSQGLRGRGSKVLNSASMEGRNTRERMDPLQSSCPVLPHRGERGKQAKHSKASISANYYSVGRVFRFKITT